MILQGLNNAGVARLEVVREAAWWWMIDYNGESPHDSPGDLTQRIPPKNHRGPKF
jgi:hypothetical protein